MEFTIRNLGLPATDAEAEGILKAIYREPWIKWFRFYRQEYDVAGAWMRTLRVSPNVARLKRQF
jgi:hypothetical protein